MKKGFLNRILEDSQSADLNLSGPQGIPVQEGETIAGVLENEDTKRLFAVHGMYMDKSNAARDKALELRSAGQEGSDEFKAALAEMSQYRVLSETAKNAFWYDVREKFGLHDKNLVGISDGWQVVWQDEPAHDCSNCPIAAMCPDAQGAGASPFGGLGMLLAGAGFGRR